MNWRAFSPWSLLLSAAFFSACSSGLAPGAAQAPGKGAPDGCPAGAGEARSPTVSTPERRGVIAISHMRKNFKSLWFALKLLTDDSGNSFAVDVYAGRSSLLAETAALDALTYLGAVSFFPAAEEEEERQFALPA
ncbi:MAG: hypothetical protein AB7P23_10425, partial [Amphiplicatus sp.]